MSALAPTSLEVVELDEALDFDPPCDMHKPEMKCADPVRWISRPSCCGKVGLGCQRIRDELDDRLLWHASIQEAMSHIPCGQKVLSIAWEPYRKADR